jgi:hypothetical protein
MATIPYDYIDQDIQATALVQVRDNDSFYNPALGHNGFAADGTRYTAGAQDALLVTHVAAASGTYTCLATNSLTTGSKVLLNGFTGNFTALNGTVQTIISTGLSDSQFEFTTGTDTITGASQPTAQVNTPSSWYSEASGPYRGTKVTFPNAGLILLSKVSLVILDESTRSLALWMQFLLSDTFALTNNFNGESNGWTPKSVCYADGVISVTYLPDEGSMAPPDGIVSRMVVSLDFAQDTVYLDVAE